MQLGSDYEKIEEGAKGVEKSSKGHSRGNDKENNG